MASLDQHQGQSRDTGRRYRFTFGGRPSQIISEPVQYTPSSAGTQSRLTLKKMASMQRPPLYKPSTSEPKMPTANNISIASPWNEDMAYWMTGVHKSLPPSPDLENEAEPFTPLPSSISRAAAKRLGISIDTPTALGSSPLVSREEWYLPRHKREESSRTENSTSPEPSSFYSSDSDSDIHKRESSMYSTDSSRTSYNASSPLPSPGRKPEQKEQLRREKEVLEESRPQPLRVAERKSSLPMSPQPQALQNSEYFSHLRIRKQSTSNPLPFTTPAPLEDTSPIRDSFVRGDLIEDDFQAMLNDRAANIRSRLREAAARGMDTQAPPAVPERSRKRLHKRVSVDPWSITPLRPSTAPAPEPSQWTDRRRKSSTPRPGPPLRVETDFKRLSTGSMTEKTRQRQERKASIGADAAEHVIVRIFENFTEFHHLFAASSINHGFHTVYKRNELKLLKRTVWNKSPAAWELLEASIKNICSRGRVKVVPDYTATSYLHAYKRDAYIISTIKSLILTRCEHCMHPDVVAALRDRNSARSVRADNALRRIWTFCTIFGNGREDALTEQMRWLRGGISVGVDATSRRPSMYRDDPSSFGCGNGNGLSMEELRDMQEMWTCVKTLLHGILGGERAAQAQKHGVFDSLLVGLGDATAADSLLEEWYHYLCTLGLPTVLELANCSTSKTTRVFNTARDMGLTKWTPLKSGASRAEFLQTAVELALEEQQPQVPRPAVLVTHPSHRGMKPSFLLPLDLGMRFQPHEAVDSTAVPRIAPKLFESPNEQVTNQLERQVAASDMPLMGFIPHIASQHDFEHNSPLPLERAAPLVQALAQHQSQLQLQQQQQPQPHWPNALRLPHNSFHMPHMPNFHHHHKSQSQPESNLQQPQPQTTQTAEVTISQSPPSPPATPPKLLSRFNNIHASSNAIRAKFSTPELKQYFDLPIMARP